MKNLKVWLVFLPLFSISCSDEYTSEMTESTSVKDYMKKSAIGSANSLNPVAVEESTNSKVLEAINGVSIDPQPTTDSQITQTTTAVDGYSVEEAEEDRRKDKDWETSVTKIVPKGTKQSVGLGLNAAPTDEAN